MTVNGQSHNIGKNYSESDTRDGRESCSCGTEHEASARVNVEKAASHQGISLSRKFSSAASNPYDRIEWSIRDASISNEKGETVFKQQGVEVPSSWSQMATNVVVSKYFRGAVDSAERETSVRQLVARVVETISTWGEKDGYFVTAEQRKIFKDELATILLEQYAAFNSPVWFNVGVEMKPQCSACFILSVDDTMDSLLELQKTEALIFKYGSGAGSNLSRIRSSKEQLSGGGIASGPVSFMRGYDAWAGTIKSGGKTRRAAKMQILDVDHPDIREFINAKRLEEEKAWALIEEGYNGGFNVPGGAYDSVFFQNSNFSVRVTDEFMKAVVEDKKFATRARTDRAVVEELNAREILRDIALGTWVCGDPGLQFDTTINEWHTTPTAGRINASNPCSEYMHLDNSACNLASINLLKFLREDGSIDAELLLHTVDVLITAQDILVDNASYPTDKIAKNASQFRQLGLGFANLGAVLMSKALPYDSDEGRALAGALMSIISAEAYAQSARIAHELSPFRGYLADQENMLRVIRKHRDEATKLARFVSTESLRVTAIDAWNRACQLGEVSGFRNAQATVLAPTGTIAFLMDCDTTGIEPDIALVKYKKLVGGGVLKIVNQSVSRALRKLGYGEKAVESILDYIDKHDTIEGATELAAKDLPVFDCAFKPLNGKRFIHFSGHLKMMAACQPFVSGAISKTVNVPESATVDEIFDTYLDAWKLGLKAVAIYRDNSKRSQPLGVNSKESKGAESSVEMNVAPMKRRKLPDERSAVTHKFSISGHEGYLTVGLYEDGTPGEIFITMAKEGSTISGIMDAFATSVSFALQYGVPLPFLVQKFSHMRFEPSGMTENKQIPFAKSVLDYIFRWLAAKFLSEEEQRAVGVIMQGEYQTQKSSEQSSSHKNKAIGFSIDSGSTSGESLRLLSFAISDDAPPCSSCGSSMMVRQGACYRCLNCGSQGGCG